MSEHGQKRVRVRRGFTLIELMVVLSLISVLILIILPNFVRAKARTRLSGCESNLRNTATALTMYSEENDQRYPVMLTSLTPTYLKIIAKCPSALDNSCYTNGYTSATTPANYTMSCTGVTHLDLSLPTGYPQYTLNGGLKEQ
ncbi:MAG: prepilin-type N-terminal cleavage/methylation domain-containing protein [Proteobacteria bacterium]|nr:prepilin-type N-terminal cleavage/methylation domain-containing protein [Pseudomonadota bacterium]